MRARLSIWHTSLWAALGLAATACGGESETIPSSPSIREHPCTDPVAAPGVPGSPTGYVECSGGWVHRAERLDCASIVPRPDPVFMATDAGSECTRDAECAHLLHGHCAPILWAADPSRSGHCVSGCVRDEDCYTGNICRCGDPVGTCVSAICSSDADCGGLLCAASLNLSPGYCSPDYWGPFACQKPEDACITRADCGANQNCEPGSSGRRCGGPGTCGRPFLVGGSARLASFVEGSGGYAEAFSRTKSLDPALQARLAEHWAENGLMEHASIAAFARFVLELLSLGAPASLVQDAQAALADEIAHTRLCFTLAGNYAGRALGPGPLPVAGALEDCSFFDIVGRAITEACIGETLAAIEAAEAAEHALDPEVKAALATIARDEGKHAELGWKFLRWAFDISGNEVRTRISERLRREIERAIAEASRARNQLPERDESASLLAHGVLSSALRVEVRMIALTALILPMSRALSEAAERLVA